MRILFVADGRSPTARSWLLHWVETGHQVHLISTYPCDPPPGLATFHIIPVAFGGMSGNTKHPGSASPQFKGWVGQYRDLLRPLRYILGPLSLPPLQSRYKALVEEIKPDLVHALRIPFEGMLASGTPKNIPLLVSIWGNDIILHARGSILMAELTRRTLRRADGLLADASRDIRLGHEWGFLPDKPSLVVPGSGGIKIKEVNESSLFIDFPEPLPDTPIIFNPRGMRPGSLRQDVFFQSIPLVLNKDPRVIFICSGMAGESEPEHWVENLGIRSNVKLWPFLDHKQVLAVFKKAQVFVSPSVHDGTPNSLLEAMACGCFPVVGDIESLREWITSGINGLLVDATSKSSLAEGIITALENPALRDSAKRKNAQIIAERATYERNSAVIETFYRNIVKVNS